MERSDDVQTAKMHLTKYLDLNYCFGSRLEFLRAIAAFTAVYAEECEHRTHKNSRIIEHIAWICEAQQVEWLFNFPRYKVVAAPQQSGFIPTGTTANEARLPVVISSPKCTEALRRYSIG